jgi:hypothetical protein
MLKGVKDRLSTYNKTCEHEVIYYKSCNNEEEMLIIENMVLTKLKIYKEQTNRDRFVLPLHKDINFFINIINESIDFFNNELICDESDLITNEEKINIIKDNNIIKKPRGRPKKEILNI